MKLTTSLIAFLILSAATAMGQQAKLEGSPSLFESLSIQLKSISNSCKFQ